MLIIKDQQFNLHKMVPHPYDNTFRPQSWTVVKSDKSDAWQYNLTLGFAAQNDFLFQCVLHSLSTLLGTYSTYFFT